MRAAGGKGLDPLPQPRQLAAAELGAANDDVVVVALAERHQLRRE
eukprot:SAG11_NODE_7537_length_1133_cov_1.259188_3_plen_44_part_01